MKYRSGLTRHQKYTCKKRKQRTQNETINITHKNRIKTNITNTTTTTTNNNIVNNVNNFNITINPYGQENFKNILSYERLDELMQKIMDNISVLYEVMYETSPNNNSFLTDLARDKYCNIITSDNKLKKKLTKTVINHRIKNFAKHIVDLTTDFFERKTPTLENNSKKLLFENKIYHHLTDRKEMTDRMKVSLYNNKKNLEQFS